MNKNIFPYNDGFEDLFADPLVIQRRLFEATQGQFYTRLMPESQTTARSPGLGPDGKPLPPLPEERIAADAVALPASAAVVEAVRYAFELLPWDRKTGEGLTEEQVIDLLDEYHAWCAKKNASTEEPPTCSPPTPDSTTSAPTTTSGSDSGSISSVFGSNVPPTPGAVTPPR
jgi:hypothetical protein